MATDAVVRIAIAIAFLFIIVPALARPRRRGTTLLERFFWNFGVGIALITIVGQIFSLARLFSVLTVLLAAALVILISRAHARGVSPWWIVRRTAENSFLALLNIFDGRVNVRRRMRRRLRSTAKWLRAETASRAVRLQIAGWTVLTAIASAIRFYRPFSTANLGYSDTYVHLYLLKLLEEGRQVDPAWGPYPRGMHFLLMTIHELTNVDEILLMNFFGAFVGVLIVLAVADTVRRLTNSFSAAMLSGVLFATLIGGPGQYFILGGAFDAKNASEAAVYRAMPYNELAENRGEFDLALMAFQRQTTTLPHELALILLFPASLFLLDYFRTRERWYLAGFAAATAAIAATHPGVLIPLIMMCAVMLAVAAIHREVQSGTSRKAIVSGAIAVIIGSAWALAFVVYPYAGGQTRAASQTAVPGSALFYFPFLRSLTHTADETRIFVGITAFLLICAALAIALIIVRRDALRTSRLWLALIFFVFIATHFASTIGLPQIVETTRNAEWLLMTMAILIGAVAVEIAHFVREAELPRWQYANAAAAAVLIALWLTRVPRFSEPAIREHLINYSGYGASAYAVLKIERSLEPYTWTVVSYGQEFPMVLRRGFHLPAADFLNRYDPTSSVIPIPTPDLFVIVEKTPHQFEINTWSQRFSRADVEQRLQTWIQLYQATHSNLRIYLDDPNVRVYQLRRTAAEIERVSRR